MQALAWYYRLIGNWSMDATTVCKSKDCDSITYVKTCLPNLYLLRNCVVFDVKNDACLVFH